MTARKGPHNQTTVPILDHNDAPLAPARPSSVRCWLETGRASKVWIKGIFAVQLHDRDAADAVVSPTGLGFDPGKTTGIAVTRESDDGKVRAIVGAYEHQHRNQEIRNGLSDRRTQRPGESPGEVSQRNNDEGPEGERKWLSESTSAHGTRRSSRYTGGWTSTS